MPSLEHGPSPLQDGLLQVAAADGAPDVVVRHDHLGAGVARGVAAYVDDRGQHTGPALPPEQLHRSCPVHQRTPSIAQNTASGVAGEASSTLVPGDPNAATASRNASRTEKASINGGSPTALEP